MCIWVLAAREMRGSDMFESPQVKNEKKSEKEVVVEVVISYVPLERGCVSFLFFLFLILHRELPKHFHVAAARDLFGDGIACTDDLEEHLLVIPEELLDDDGALQAYTEREKNRPRASPPRPLTTATAASTSTAKKASKSPSRTESLPETQALALPKTLPELPEQPEPLPEPPSKGRAALRMVPATVALFLLLAAVTFTS